MATVPSPAALLILVLNGGSSSVRYAWWRVGREGALELLEGGRREGPQGDLDEMAEGPAIRAHGGAPAAVGHRFVHGFSRFDPTAITPALLAQLRRIAPLDPDHLPSEIALAEAAMRRWPDVPHIACFDTAFHRDLPRVAALLPLPRRYEAMGVRRYGFHGLSYTWLMEALERRAGREAARGRVILAHLGGGASLAAVREGRCIDTTMGFTPCGGLVMGTRAGDLDPGLLVWLARAQGLSADALSDLVDKQSGLLGLSGTSADVRTLLAEESQDVRAAEAIAVFCDRIRKGIGAFAATLGGLDTLVFSGGIGEHAAAIRTRVCDGLGFLGIEMDEARNERHGDVVSAQTSRVAVHVIPTDEERVIARAAATLLGLRAAS